MDKDHTCPHFGLACVDEDPHHFSSETVHPQSAPGKNVEQLSSVHVLVHSKCLSDDPIRGPDLWASRLVILSHFYYIAVFISVFHFPCQP